VDVQRKQRDSYGEDGFAVRDYPLEADGIVLDPLRFPLRFDSVRDGDRARGSR
jgi:hypothetical protein